MEMPRRMSRQARDSLPFFRSDWMSSSQSEKSKTSFENGYTAGDEISQKNEVKNEAKISTQ